MVEEAVVPFSVSVAVVLMVAGVVFEVVLVVWLDWFVGWWVLLVVLSLNVI